MEYTTFSGKKIEGQLTGFFRAPTEEEFEKYDDKSKVTIGVIPGSGNLIASRISEYYFATIKIGENFGTALLHADAIIAAHSSCGRIRKGYRNGSLTIYHQCDGHWYNWGDDDDGSVSEIQEVVFDALSGKINIDDEILRSQENLISIRRIPASSETIQTDPIVKLEQKEETDEELASRIVRAAQYHDRLFSAKKEILCETYHLL